MEGKMAGPRRRTKASATAAAILGIAVSGLLALSPFGVQAAGLDDSDTTRLAGLIDQIKAFEDDVSSALHNVPPGDAEAIESYAYVQLNLEAAHERLNTVFMLVAVSGYVESATDQLLILDLMHGQLLPQSKSYLNQKMDNIASMAAAHPADQALANYATRAAGVLGERGVRLLDEFDRKIAEIHR
jgi:hypothetical protein